MKNAPRTDIGMSMPTTEKEDVLATGDSNMSTTNAFLTARLTKSSLQEEVATANKDSLDITERIVSKNAPRDHGGMLKTTDANANGDLNGIKRNGYVSKPRKNGDPSKIMIHQFTSNNYQSPLFNYFHY